MVGRIQRPITSQIKSSWLHTFSPAVTSIIDRSRQRSTAKSPFFRTLSLAHMHHGISIGEDHFTAFTLVRTKSEVIMAKEMTITACHALSLSLWIKFASLVMWLSQFFIYLTFNKYWLSALYTHFPLLYRQPPYTLTQQLTSIPEHYWLAFLFSFFLLRYNLIVRKEMVRNHHKWPQSVSKNIANNSVTLVCPLSLYFCQSCSGISHVCLRAHRLLDTLGH